MVSGKCGVRYMRHCSGNKPASTYTILTLLDTIITEECKTCLSIHDILPLSGLIVATQWFTLYLSLYTSDLYLFSIFILQIKLSTACCLPQAMR